MPPLTATPVESTQIESLSGDGAEVRAVLERNLTDARSMLREKVAERCVMSAVGEVVSLAFAAGTGQEIRSVLTNNVVFIPQDGTEWLIRAEVESFSIDGELRDIEEFETVYDSINHDTWDYSEVPRPVFRSIVNMQGLMSADHPINTYYSDPANYFAELLSGPSFEEGEVYSYAGESTLYGRRGVRYEHRLPGALYAPSSVESEVLVVVEFLLDNPLLLRTSTYQGPVDGVLNLIRMAAATEFGPESC